MMKKVITCLTVFMIGSIMMMGQERFNPEKIKTEVHNAILNEVKLTKEEAETFFPLFDAMKDKQRNIYKQIKEISRQHPATDAACRNAIIKRDQLQREMQKVEEAYHQKMLKAMSPSKVYKALEVEKKYMRNSFRKAVKK